MKKAGWGVRRGKMEFEEEQRWGGGIGEVGQDMDCRGGMGPPGAHRHTHTALQCTLVNSHTHCTGVHTSELTHTLHCSAH